MTSNTPSPGSHYIYPGHPLIVALCALKVFGSAKDALAPSIDRDTHQPRGWSKMVGHCDIPGSGNAAYNGECVLQAIWNGTKTVEQAVVYADEMWRRSVGPDNFGDRYEPGQQQADQYKDEFRTQAASWDWSK